MLKNELKTNLHLLAGLKAGGGPSRLWVHENRRALLRHILAGAPAESTAVSLSALFLSFLQISRPALRPAFALVLALAVTFGAFSVGVGASYASVPGDPLYAVKRATERAQLVLTPSAPDRARLQVEFVGRRVEEVSRLAELPVGSRGTRLEEAVANLRSDVSEVQNELVTLKDSEPTMALSVAQLVDRKTGEYHNTLRKSDIASSLPDAAIQEAKSIVADASVKAVAIIIEGQSHGGWQLSKEAVAAKIGDKIKSVADRVSDLEQSSSASSSPAAMGSAREAKSALDAAKVLVEQQDLSGALVKVIEGKELIKAAEQIASAANLEFARPTSTLSDAESAASAAIKSGMSEDTRPRIIVSSTPDIAPDLPTASSTIPVIRILD